MPFDRGMLSRIVLAFALLQVVPASRPLPGQLSAKASAWQDPTPHRILRVSVAPQVELEVIDWGGSGSPLIFLAGGGNTAHVFDGFAPRFTSRFHVWGITRRG